MVEKSIKIALEYIKGKGKLVSSDLVSYMDSAKVPYDFRTTETTTRYVIITELKRRGSITIPKRRHGQKQFLIFNDKSEYDWIVAVTEKVKKVIEAMEEPIEKVFLQAAEWAANSSTEEAMRGAPMLKNLQDDIQSRYWHRYEIMLQYLWNRTNSVIQSEKDKQVLHTIIVNLMMKINDQFWRHRPLKDILKLLAYKTEIPKSSLWKKMGITKELMDELNAPPENFIRLFSELSQS
jgi:hypothetical protein